MNYPTSFELLNSYITPSARVRTFIPLIPSSASISVSADKVLTVIARQNIIITDRLEVEDFLTNHYGTIAHLYNIPEKVTSYFGESKMKLGVFSEPDSTDTPDLYLEVETSLSPEEANARLSALNREWILSTNDDDLMVLNITLRFI